MRISLKDWHRVCWYLQPTLLSHIVLNCMFYIIGVGGLARLLPCWSLFWLYFSHGKEPMPDHGKPALKKWRLFNWLIKKEALMEIKMIIVIVFICILYWRYWPWGSTVLIVFVIKETPPPLLSSKTIYPAIPFKLDHCRSNKNWFHNLDPLILIHCMSFSCIVSCESSNLLLA